MKQILTFLALLATIVSQAQLAGDVDMSFSPNNNGFPFLTDGYSKVVGVEVINNSVYYALSGENGLPKIRKYNLEGNEDENWYNNQMSTWGTLFSTFCLEPERDSDGNYTGKFFISGRNTANAMVNQGVRFLNKINADGTRDLNFVCPNISWTNICSTIYHDWENNKLYYSYQTGYSQNNYSQTIVSCDPNTGQILQTITIPGVNGLIKKITKIPNTNELVIGGDLNFEYNGFHYVGMFRLNSSFNIAPVNGITDLPSNAVVNDILFVNDSECDGTLIGSTTAYIAGTLTQMSGVSNFRNLVRYNVSSNGDWTIDTNYNAGCSGVINDIVYYNCHLIATGNFASSMSTGPYAPMWTPKVTAFTSEGVVSDEFKLINIGHGLGGVNMPSLENSFGQGVGTCLAVHPYEDGNDRWEIFIGGTFINLIQSTSPNDILMPINYMAKLYGFGITLNPRFNYCLTELNEIVYSISASALATTSGCEKWELFESNSPTSGWDLITTSIDHDFIADDLVTGMWYKLVRTVSECGNVCSSSYIIYRDPQNCQIQNNGAELRFSTPNEPIITPIQPERESVDILISPNPSPGLIIIKDKSKNMFRDISLYNSIGVKVLTTTSTNETYQMDLTYLPTGVYMLVVTTDEGVKQQQVIKE